MKLFSRLPSSAWLCFASFALGLLVGGCGTPPKGDGKELALLQQLLDRVVPTAFTGDLILDEAFPGAVALDAKIIGLWHDGQKWQWAELRWKRNGVWTKGNLTLIARPRAEVVPAEKQ